MSPFAATIALTGIAQDADRDLFLNMWPACVQRAFTLSIGSWMHDQRAPHLHAIALDPSTTPRRPEDHDHNRLIRQSPSTPAQPESSGSRSPSGRQFGSDAVDRTGRYSNRSHQVGRPRLLELLTRCERELADLAALLRQNDDRSS